MKQIFRKNGVICLLSLSALAFLYSQVILDFHLKYLAERFLTELNGAKVNIGSLKIRWMAHQVDLAKVEVGNSTSPMRNLVELDKVVFNFHFLPLLSKKLIVDHCAITGVRIGTQRNSSAYLSYDPDEGMIPMGFFERGTGSVYSANREELSQNPLRYLGYLAGGLNIHATLESLHSQLKTSNELRQSVDALDLLEKVWAANSKNIPTPAEFTSLKKQVQSARNLAQENPKRLELQALLKKQEQALLSSAEVEKQFPIIKAKLAQLDDFVQEDIQFIRTKLSLPRLDLPDLTPHVFGTAMVDILEKLSYWQELSRKVMPPPTSENPSTFTIQGSTLQNTRVHFGRNHGIPSILLKRLVLSSHPDTEKTTGTVNAIIDGLTLDPSIYNEPVTIKLEADFPEESLRNVTLSALIDHTSPKPVEHFNIKIEGLPLSDYTLHSSQDIRLSINRAKANIEFSLDGNGDSLVSNWNGQFSDADFRVESRFKLAEEAIRTLLQDLYNFKFSGQASGQRDQIKLEMHSEVGTHLAEGLRHSFRHQLAAIEENLRSNIRDQIASERQRLEDKIKDFESRTFAQYHKAKELLSDLERLSEG